MDEDGIIRKNRKNVKPPLKIEILCDEKKSHTYSLAGIITHLGSSMNTGHYIAEIMYKNCYYKCDDAFICKTTQSALSKEGYGFLFKRC